MDGSEGRRLLLGSDTGEQCIVARGRKVGEMIPVCSVTYSCVDRTARDSSGCDELG